MLKRGVFAGALFAGALFGQTTSPEPPTPPTPPPLINAGGGGGSHSAYVRKLHREETINVASYEAMDIQDILTMVAKTWL